MGINSSSGIRGGISSFQQEFQQRNDSFALSANTEGFYLAPLITATFVDKIFSRQQIEMATGNRNRFYYHRTY